MKKSANIIFGQTGLQQEESGSDISAFEILRTLWSRKRLLLTTALFIIAIGLIILHQKPPRYTATSSILIGVQKSQIVDIDAIVAGIPAGNYSAIVGEIQVLKSRGLARKVVGKLDLASLPEFNPSLRPPSLTSYFNPIQYFPDSWIPTADFTPPLGQLDAIDKDKTDLFSTNTFLDAWKLAVGAKPAEQLTDEELEERRTGTATSIFLSKLKTSQREQFSTVVNISFESLDPRLAAKIANEVPESYIIGQMEAKFEATEKATTWLNDQLADLKIKVEESEQAVQYYREQYDITETQGGEIVVEQLSAINSQVIIARAELAQAQARYSQMRKLTNGEGSGAESALEVLSSTLIQGLQKQEAELAQKTSEYLSVYGPKHPKMIQIKSEIAEVQRRIKREIVKIASGLKNEVDVARIRESSLETSLAQLKKASGEQNRESVELRALEREAAANRTLFETFLGRFKETSSTGGLQREADARVISQAGVPRGPSYPNIKKASMLIVAAAFIFAAMLVFLLHALSSGLVSPEQIENDLGVPAIGLIPRVKKGLVPHDYILNKPHSNYAESLSSLRTSLILSAPDDAVKTIQVTSSVPEEGKSTLTISLARLLAQSGEKTILIDGDLRRPSLEEKLCLPTGHKGLTDLLMATDAALSEFVIRDPKSRLLIMPKGGGEYLNASDIISSHRMERIITYLRKRFDYVIIDTPPILAVSDAKIFGRLVDKTVFVVHWDKTPKKHVKSAIQQLVKHEVDIAGCVLQQVNLKRYGSYGYGNSGNYSQYYSS
ncbi:MAG: succinoglycan biosynthesis transport protein ExoP [Saprospiraceae bacterium]|jgi:succinoglycan biosynthesis transport protein ExoP